MYPEDRNSGWCQKGGRELPGLSGEHPSCVHADGAAQHNALQHGHEDMRIALSEANPRDLGLENEDQI